MTTQATESPTDGVPGEDAPPKIRREDFDATDIEGPIRDTNHMDYRTIGQLYAQAALDQNGSGNEVAERVYGLLQSMVQMHFKPEDAGEPYGPYVVDNGRRTIIPSDLRGQSSALAEIAAGIRHPALQARLADIAWHNDRKLAAMADVTITAYCHGVRLVLDGQASFAGTKFGASCRDAVRMLRRACRIANATGRKEHHRKAIDSIVQRVVKHAIQSEHYNGFLEAASLARAFGCVDPATLAMEAETLASRVDVNRHLARDLWGLAANCHRESGNVAEANRCRGQAAECLVALADAAGDNAMVSAAFLRDAIQALREVVGTRDRRQELQRRLTSVQESIQDEMGVVSTALDIENEVDAVTKGLQGVSLGEAMGLFADLLRSPEPADLREQALRIAEENPLSSMMPSTTHDDEGKVVATSPGLTGNEEQDDVALHQLVARNESLRRQYDALAVIEPARRVIVTEHAVDVTVMRRVVEQSLVVPGDRVGLYAVGLSRFFHGDYATALHVLVPQLENSLRHLLKLAGSDPSAIRTDMIHENRTLSTMLQRDRDLLEKVLSGALVFEIESLFDFKGGPALRHGVAHGLLSDGQCNTREAIYACWFVYRLCCLPLLERWPEVSAGLDE